MLERLISFAYLGSSGNRGGEATAAVACDLRGMENIGAGAAVAWVP